MDYTDAYEHKNFIRKVTEISYIFENGRSGFEYNESIPSDQSLTGLLDELSTSTMGPGKFHSITERLRETSVFFLF